MRFGIRDSGPGLSEEAQRSLYRSFQRVDRRGELRFSASGLGLTVAKTLIESMGSELECESRADEGTVFSFNVQLPPV